jgi:hypothetical protein
VFGGTCCGDTVMRSIVACAINRREVPCIWMEAAGCGENVAVRGST